MSSVTFNTDPSLNPLAEALSVDRSISIHSSLQSEVLSANIKDNVAWIEKTNKITEKFDLSSNLGPGEVLLIKNGSRFCLKQNYQTIFLFQSSQQPMLTAKDVQERERQINYEKIDQRLVAKVEGVSYWVLRIDAPVPDERSEQCVPLSYTTRIFTCQEYTCDWCNSDKIIKDGVFHQQVIALSDEYNSMDMCLNCTVTFLNEKQANVLEMTPLNLKPQERIAELRSAFLDIPSLLPYTCPIRNLVKEEYIESVSDIFKNHCAGLKETDEQVYRCKTFIMNVLFEGLRDKANEPVCGFPYNGIRRFGQGEKPDVDLMITKNVLPAEECTCFAEIIQSFLNIDGKEVAVRKIAPKSVPVYRGANSSQAKIDDGTQILFTKEAFRDFVKKFFDLH